MLDVSAGGVAQPVDGRLARTLRSLWEALARESLPILVCSMLGILVALLLPHALSSDGWLTLVAGRLIARNGLPHHDHLAMLTAGRRWVDQQWLGQIVVYGLEAAGGIRAVLAANALLVLAGFLTAVGFARRRGGAPATVAVVALVVALPFLVTAMNVRTQSLVYLPFVALVWLLTGRVTPWRSVAALGALAVWANVHGSVLLAAVVVSLRGVIALVEDRPARPTASALALTFAPWLCVIFSPYHLHLLSYYGTTAFNPSFSKYLSQWGPTTFSPISAPLLVMLFGVIWLLGRCSRAYSVYERCLLITAVLIGLLAVRNWPFSVLVVLMLAPVGIDRAFRRGESRPAPVLGAVVAVVAAGAAAVALVQAVSQPPRALTPDYPVAAANAAARLAARTGSPVYAGTRYSDWLLWTHPELDGRIAFDVRYELLTASEVKRLVLFDNGSGLDDPLVDVRVFILDPLTEKDALAGLRSDVRTFYETDHALVALRKTP